MKSKIVLVLILSACCTYLAMAQNAKEKSDKPVTISGKVLNPNMAPVVGAVMYIDNVKTSINTDAKGKYKIKVGPDAVTLEVRSSQYGTCEFKLNGEKEINFTLDGDNSKAYVPDKETAGKSNDTDRSQKNRAKKMNTYSDIFQMIRAEVSGVTVSGRSVQIQQAHSFFGTGAPLFVINGVIVNSIDDVNPLEVKAIKVLKGSEAAIYGVRGSNGVISITLKNGTEKE